eukprot:253274_1
MTLQNMKLIDYYKSENMIIKSMIQRTDVLQLKKQNTMHTIIDMKENPLLNVEVELNPLNETSDVRIFLRAHPVTIDLHIPVLLRLSQFFIQKRQVDMHAFKQTVLSQLKTLQNTSRVFEKKVSIDAEFYGATIVLREDPTNNNSTKLVSDLGTISIKAEPKSINSFIQVGNNDAKDNEESSPNVVINNDTLQMYYDCINIILEDIKVYLDVDIPKNHLLTPLNICAKIYLNKCASNLQLPTVVLKADVQTITAKLASSHIGKIYLMLQNLIVEMTCNTELSRNIATRHTNDYDEKVEHKFDYDKQVELLHKVNIWFSVRVSNIQVSIVNDDNHSKTEKLKLIMVSNINGIYFYLQQRKWDFTVEAGLAEVIIKDYVCVVNKFKERPCLMRTSFGTQKSQFHKHAEFFKLNLQRINAKSPKYENRDTLLNIAIGDVTFYFRPETIDSLLEVFVKNIIQNSEKFAAQNGLHFVGEFANKIRTERKTKTYASSEKKAKTVKIQIEIMLNSLQWYICANQFNICKSSMEEFKLNLKMYPCSMDLMISLGNILLTDETYIADLITFPNYPYKVIIGHIPAQNKNVEEKSMHRPALNKEKTLNLLEFKTDVETDPLLKFALNTYSDREIDYPGYENKIDIEIKGMRFTFLNRFLDEILKWLTNSSLLKIPQLIIHQLTKHNLEMNESDKSCDEKKKLSQMRILVENMQFLVPKSSVSRDYVMGSLERLIVSNDALDNNKMIIQIDNVSIATRFGLNKQRQTVSLFTQPSIHAILSNQFTDITIEFAQISMQLSHKQYEFLMEVSYQNLREEAQVSSRVYPVQQVIIKDVISDEQKQRAINAMLAAVKKQMKQKMRITVVVNAFSVHLLKKYGFEFDSITLNGKDSLVGFGIIGLFLNINIDQRISVKLSMNDIRLKDCSSETEQNGVQDVYRDLIAFNSNFTVEEESMMISNAFKLEKQTLYPFCILAQVNQTTNKASVEVRTLGLQFTFGNILWTLLEFNNINPKKQMKLPRVDEELFNYEKSLFLCQKATMIAQEKMFERTDEKKFMHDEDDLLEVNFDQKKNRVSMSLKVDIQIHNTMIKFIKFPKLQKSPAVVFQLDVIALAKMDKRNLLAMEVNIERIQAYQAMISVEGKQLDILVKDNLSKIVEPFDINVTLRQYKSVFDGLRDRTSHSKGMKGNLEIKTMVVRFANGDFDILWNVLNAIAPPMLEPTDNDDKKCYDHVDDHEYYPIPGEKVKNKINKDEELTDIGEMEFSVKIGTISVSFVNDTHPTTTTPLIQFVTQNYAANLYSYKQRMLIAVKFGFYADCWNNQCGLWEPMIENWSAKANMITNTDCMYLQFVPDNTFNVLFTHHVLKAIIEAVMVLSGDKNSKQHDFKSTKETIYNVKPYCLKNQTEFALRVRCWQSDELTDYEKKDIENMLLHLTNGLTDQFKVGSMDTNDFCTYPIEIEKKFKSKVGIEISLDDDDDYEPFIVWNTNQMQERTYY